MTLKFKIDAQSATDIVAHGATIESVTDCELAERISDSARELVRVRGTSDEFLAIADAVHIELRCASAEYRKEQCPDSPIPDDQADLYPGRIAYVSDASYVCHECATSIRNPVLRGEETDIPHHCDSCGTLITGFTLTDDGVRHVVDAALESKRDNEVIESWLSEYEYEIQDYTGGKDSDMVVARIDPADGSGYLRNAYEVAQEIYQAVLSMPTDSKRKSHGTIIAEFQHIFHSSRSLGSNKFAFAKCLQNVVALANDCFRQDGTWGDMKVAIYATTPHEGPCYAIAPMLWHRLNE